MARKYKSRVTTEKLDAKIEQQKETLEKAKARYEAEKDALAELVKMRNELRKEELMDAVHALVKIKKVPESVVFEALEMVLLTAYKKEHGNAVKASIDMDHTTGKYHI
mgnify:FL=1